MREWETRSWQVGKSEKNVIDQVGRRLADRLLELTSPGDRLAFLCGVGNNGADGWAAISKLGDRRTQGLKAACSTQLLKDLKDLLRAEPDWVVDALFGIGLNRPLDSNWQKVLKMLKN